MSVCCTQHSHRQKQETPVLMQPPCSGWCPCVVTQPRPRYSCWCPCGAHNTAPDKGRRPRTKAALVFSLVSVCCDTAPRHQNSRWCPCVARYTAPDKGRGPRTKTAQNSRRCPCAAYYTAPDKGRGPRTKTAQNSRWCPCAARYNPSPPPQPRKGRRPRIIPGATCSPAPEPTRWTGRPRRGPAASPSW